MKKIIALLAVTLMYTQTAWPGMYKCTDTNGKISYQQTPCAGETKSDSQIEVNTRTASRPFPHSGKNKNLLRYYTIHVNQKVIVDACVRRKSSYADDISQAHQRFFEIAEENIAKGQEIAETGLVGLPTSEIRSIQRKAHADKKIELRGMDKKKLDRLCSSHAGKLRRLASQVPNRSSGYEEGDLDPEGND